MKTQKQIEERIQTIKEVITFASLIKLDTTAIANLQSFNRILRWVIEDEEP